jgi:hypothetical protein
MQMIWHHNPFVQLNTLTNRWCSQPFLRDDFTDRRQPNIAVYDIAKETFLSARTDRDEIPPG